MALPVPRTNFNTSETTAVSSINTGNLTQTLLCTLPQWNCHSEVTFYSSQTTVLPCSRSGLSIKACCHYVEKNMLSQKPCSWRACFIKQRKGLAKDLRNQTIT